MPVRITAHQDCEVCQPFVVYESEHAELAGKLTQCFAFNKADQMRDIYTVKQTISLAGLARKLLNRSTSPIYMEN